jgi:hypothetical protein
MIDGKMSVEDYNKSFADNLKKRFGDQLIDGKTDDQIVELYISRENIQYEEPFLEVKHSGITDDGRIKMEMDWNTAFIKHLAANGIEAETEEEAVQKYLSLLTSNALEHEGVSEEDAELRDQLEAETQAELEIAAQQLMDSFAEKKQTRKRAYK